MQLSNATPAPRTIPGWLWTSIIYSISIGCLIWVYHGFDWKGELPRLRHIHWKWIFVAVAADMLVYVTQAWRWNILMRPAARVPFWRSVQAIYVGLFANEVLPLRSGELVRCYLVSHWDKVRLPLVLSSALIERLVDGVILILGFALVAWTTPDVPKILVSGAGTLAVVVAVLGALVLFAVLNKRFAHHVTTRHRWSEVLRLLIEGLHAMGRSHTLLVAVAASLVYMVLQVVPIYAMMAGYGVDSLTLADAAIVLVVLRLATVVPGLPGNLGLFNFAAYLALHHMLHLPAQTAKTLSAVMFVVITLPLLVGGWVALAWAGVELKDVLHRARASHQAKEPAAH